ncbi:MAG: aldolase/citrate lyase family protein [Pseudomonadota bacterium]
MQFIQITNDPERAGFVEKCGVDRVMVDLEILGKKARQGGLDTVISKHTLADVSKVRSALRHTTLQVRINPIHEGSEKEVEEVISRGADRIMLPMFSDARQVRLFLDMVDRRAATTLLLETPQALIRIEEIVSQDGIDEIHIGLNDLHLGLGLDFMFELILSPVIELVCGAILRRGIPLGIGGVASLDFGQVPAKLILPRLIELGANATILSRSFSATNHAPVEKNIDDTFERNFSEIRAFCESVSGSDIDANHVQLRAAIDSVVCALRETRRGS